MNRSRGPSGSGAWTNRLTLNYIIDKTRFFLNADVSIDVFLNENKPTNDLWEHTSVMWAGRVCSWERGGFYVTRDWRRGGVPGGRNFKSCLQISLRARKAPGEHLWAESSPTPFPLLPIFLSDGWTYLFQREDIYFRTSGINQSADLCEPYAGVTDICEVEEEECIVSLWN